MVEIYWKYLKLNLLPACYSKNLSFQGNKVYPIELHCQDVI